MGCSNQKATEADEVKKDDKNDEEVLLEKKQENLEEFEIVKQNEDNSGKEEKEIKEQLDNNEKDVEEEEKSEEIPDNMNVNEEQDLENHMLSSINNSNSMEQKSNELKRSSNNIKSKDIKKTKKKKNINKKKPFIITEISTNPFQKVKIVINACSFCDEYMMPIWCNRDAYIKFKVEGKWRIDKNYDYTDSKGLPSNNSSGFNYGALIGRIGRGAKFVVSNENTILVKKGGPLFLRQNLPKKMKIEPDGKLIISVYDGEYKKISEINKLIGWKENGAIEETNNNKNNDKSSSDVKSNKSYTSCKREEMLEKEIEKNLIKHLNNLRMNPTLFYEKYINFNTKLIKTKYYLDKIEKKEKIALEENNICYEYLGNFFSLPYQIQFKKNVNKNNLSSNLLQLEEDISYFLYDHIGRTVKSKSKITQKENPIEIILQFLLDKQFRVYIFNAHSQSLTIKLIKNFFGKSTLVVMAIVLDRDYFQEEEEFDKIFS